MAVDNSFADVDALGWSLSGPAEEALRGHAGEALDRLARWYLHRPGTLPPGEVVHRDRPYAEDLEVLGARPGPLDDELGALGVPAEVAARARRLGALASVGELAEAARAAGRPLGVAADAYPVLEDGLCLAPLLWALRRRPAPDRWERWQLRSLADDLAHSRGLALVEALRRSPSLDGRAAGHDWLAGRTASVRRACALAHRVEVGAPPSMSLIALAVRAVGDAVHAG
jgi:NAD-specific glutamate dehydrogenase